MGGCQGQGGVGADYGGHKATHMPLSFIAFIKIHNNLAHLFVYLLIVAFLERHISRGQEPF